MPTVARHRRAPAHLITHPPFGEPRILRARVVDVDQRSAGRTRALASARAPMSSQSRNVFKAGMCR